MKDNLKRAAFEIEKASALIKLLEDMMVDWELNRPDREQMEDGANAFYALEDAIETAKTNLRAYIQDQDCSEMLR